MNRDLFLKFKEDNIKNWGRLIARDSNDIVTGIRQFLKEATPFLPEGTRITQRAWHVINNLYKLPSCKYCNGAVKYDMNDHAYRTYCSIKCSSLCPDYRNSLEASNIEKYGVPYPAMCETVYEKVINTNLERYGVKYTSQAESTKQKQKTTNLQRYGVVSTSQVPEVKNKQLKSNYDRYGILYSNSTNLSATILDKLNNKDWLHDRHVNDKLTCTEIGDILGCDVSTVAKYFKKHNIEVKRFFRSIFEKEVSEYIQSLGLDVVENDRSVISGHEIDIYIPSLKIGIECNGVYWHSELFKHKHYHSDKFDKSVESGIRLIQILENEWNDSTNVVKNKLKNIIGLDKSNAIYARKCVIRTVSLKEKREFYDRHHIQGNGPSSINYGLEYEGKLVAVLGFIVQTNSLILNRYATACRVVGGFSKLLKYTEHKHDRPEIVTYADLRWSNGGIYYDTGFELVERLLPDYYWCKGNRVWHKFNWRHAQMSQHLNNYNPDLSETINMSNHGFFKLWDTGKLKFIKNKRAS